MASQIWSVIEFCKWLERAYHQVSKSKKGYGFAKPFECGHREKANSHEGAIYVVQIHWSVKFAMAI